MLLANRNLLERFYYPQTEGEKFVKHWTSLVLAGLPIGLWLVNLNSLRSIEDVRKFVTSSMFVGAVLINAIVHIAGRVIASMVKAANPNTLAKTLRAKGPEISDNYTDAAKESYYDPSCLKDIDCIFIYEQTNRIHFFQPLDSSVPVSVQEELLKGDKNVLFVAHVHDEGAKELAYSELNIPSVTRLKKKFKFIIILAPKYEENKVIEAICDPSKWQTADQLVLQEIK